uniref:Uncharacterized protein n=1 Tax=Arundo donax TaxID=35708 RepID=A0A0A8YNK9_ARUDO
MPVSFLGIRCHSRPPSGCKVNLVGYEILTSHKDMWSHEDN